MRALVERLRSEDEVRAARCAYTKVFSSSNPFDEPLAPDVPARWLLYPVGYGLWEPEWSVVAGHAVGAGQTHAYVSLLEAGPDFVSVPHWRIGLVGESPYEVFHDEPGWLPISHAVYSASGTWGMMFSSEQHAVVGGPAGLVDALRHVVPEARDVRSRFIAAWRENAALGGDASWLPGFLRHIFGE